MSPEGTRVVGYLRVSTAEQANSGAGLAAQRAAIEAEVERRGWVLVAMLEDAGVSGKSTRGRRGLEAAVTLVDTGQADAIVAAKVDRLARSLLDFCRLTEGRQVIALDAGFDQTAPAGVAMRQMLGVFAELERAMISQRTRDGLAAKRAGGVVLGRPANVPERVLTRIRRAHEAGESLAGIARALNDDAVPTSGGDADARWHASTVRAILRRL